MLLFLHDSLLLTLQAQQAAAKQYDSQLFAEVASSVPENDLSGLLAAPPLSGAPGARAASASPAVCFGFLSSAGKITTLYVFVQ
jgi:hypothetical protein